MYYPAGSAEGGDGENWSEKSYEIYTGTGMASILAVAMGALWG
jgi:hypothetical protein